MSPSMTLGTEQPLTPFYLLLQGTVEDEDKHALERIEDSEEVSHDYCVLINKQKAKSPCQPQ